MYIWIGCELPKEFELDMRDACLEAAEGLDLDFSGFTLPQHISLKISFQAGDAYFAVLDFIACLLQKEKQFYVNLGKPEQVGGILWVSFRESGILRRVHDLLDRELKRQYGVPQHLFDKAFAFHSTLAVGDPGEIRVLHQRLGGLKLPENLDVRAFLLGISETGKSGTYRVVRRIEI